MGDRAQQIVSEWFVKCANVVIQSRLAAGATERAPRERQNRWVRPRPLRDRVASRGRATSDARAHHPSASSST